MSLSTIVATAFKVRRRVSREGGMRQNVDVEMDFECGYTLYLKKIFLSFRFIGLSQLVAFREE